MSIFMMFPSKDFIPLIGLSCIWYDQTLYPLCLSKNNDEQATCDC